MSVVSRLIPQFVARELDRPLKPSAHVYSVIDELRASSGDDATRAIAVTYAEETVCSELDNLIDVLQDDDMSSSERQQVAVDFVARAVVLADAVGVDELLLATTIDGALHEAVAELKKTVDFGPSRESAGLYNVEEDSPLPDKKPWNATADGAVTTRF